MAWIDAILEGDTKVRKTQRHRADYPRDLLRLCELERIDRERRNVARRIRLARFPTARIIDA